MRLLFDTDVCIYLINRRPGFEQMLERLDGVPRTQTFVSTITVAELQHGLAKPPSGHPWPAALASIPSAKSARRNHNLKRVIHFLGNFEVASFDEAAATAYGPLRAELERKGRPIGPLDTLIAAQALALRAVLVTNNTREFGRVRGLDVESWFPQKS